MPLRGDHYDENTTIIAARIQRASHGEYVGTIDNGRSEGWIIHRADGAPLQFTHDVQPIYGTVKTIPIPYATRVDGRFTTISRAIMEAIAFTREVDTIHHPTTED